METQDASVAIEKHVGSIKNLIKLFEGVSDTRKPDIQRNTVHLHKPGSKKITETFEQIDQEKSVVKKDEMVSQLERRVSVRSLVCNFQKLASNKEINITSAKRFSEPNQPIEVKNYSDNETNIPHMQSSLFESKIISNLVESPAFCVSELKTTTDEEILSEEEVSSTGGYCLNNAETSSVKSNSEFSDVEMDDDIDILDALPLGNGITPLPISYKVIVSKNGRLDIKLPDPPTKACFKSSKKSNSACVEFKDDHEEAETYNMMEYTRADPDLDILAATAEYEFEKMLERMDKIPVSMKRSNNEKLGLQVYGVSVRSSSEHNNMAIYVKSVTPGSLCERSGTIHVDDLIIEINNESLIGVGVSKVHEVIQKSNETITLLLGREPKSLENDDR